MHTMYMPQGKEDKHAGFKVSIKHLSALRIRSSLAIAVCLSLVLSDYIGTLACSRQSLAVVERLETQP